MRQAFDDYLDEGAQRVTSSAMRQTSETPCTTRESRRRRIASVAHPVRLRKALPFNEVQLREMS